MLILELEDTLQDQAHIIQDAYFKSSQIHQLTTMCRYHTTIYHFEHTNHDIFLNLLFQNLEKVIRAHFRANFSQSSI